MRWYYSVSGKAEGPVTQDFLIDQLKAGKFTLVDLVFKEGESAWKTFGEWPEFREAYQAPPPAYVPPVQPPMPSIAKDEITLDEISIDEFTPTPILTQPQPAAQAAPVTRAEPHQTATHAAPVHTGSSTPHHISSFITAEEAAAPHKKESVVVPESTVARGFVKPEEGWPSDWRLSSSWIVLKKRTDGGGYDQDGPFSAEHIIEMIGQGKIEYSQYCWKPGYTRWFRIGNLPEFDRRKRDRENDTVNQIIPIPKIGEALPALTREELLSNVERLRRERKTSEQAPAGTTGKNLIETSMDHYPQAVSLEPVAAPRATSIVHESPAETFVAKVEAAPDFDAHAIAPGPAPMPKAWRAAQTKRRLEMSPKMMRAALAGVVALVVVFGLFSFMSAKRREPASTQPPVEHKVKPTNARPKTSMNEAAPAASGPQAPAPAAESPKEAPRVASSLEINSKDLETAAKLEFATDMGPQDKITVKLKGHTGEILALGSFQKTFEVPASTVAGVPPTLDLAKEGLPAGAYFVEAQVGTAQSSTQIFVGKKDDVFTRELERHLKSISLRQQSEKSALFYGAQALEKLAKQLVDESASMKTQPLKWRRSFAAWRTQAREAALPVITLSKSPVNEQTYPEEIGAFQAATDKLAAQAKDIDAAISQKRDVASAPTAEVAVQFGQLREDSAKLTGRPHTND